MNRIIIAICAIAVCCAAQSVPCRAEESVPLVQSFLGINQSSDYAGIHNMGLGWERDHVQPGGGWPTTPGGKFDYTDYDRKVLDAKAHGITLLPILAYVAPYAGLTKNYEFDYKGVHYLIDVKKDDSVEGGYKRTRIWTDPATGKQMKAVLNNSRISPRRDLWEKYVEDLVSHYSKPPFNIKYWQVWNEGTMESGVFWDENIENYVDNIHIPAAKIIRKYGCKVVWGGWPDCNSLAEYDYALSYHDAWKYTDILDVHYLPPVANAYLYTRWISPGKCTGIWMTEIGFTQSLEVIANTYPRMFYWGLKHQFDYADKYKVFWFAWSGAANCCLWNGSTLAAHGQQIQQFSQLLSGSKTEAFDSFRTDPKIAFDLNERNASVEGFRVDGKLVFAFHIPVTYSSHWIDWSTGDSRHMGFQHSNHIKLILPGSGAKTYTARVVPLPGAEAYDVQTRKSGGDLEVDIVPPIHAGESSTRPMPTEAVFYIVLQQTK